MLLMWGSWRVSYCSGLSVLPPFPHCLPEREWQSYFIRESKLILGGIWGFFQFRNSPVFLQMEEKRARRVASAAREQAVGLSLCDRQLL